MLLPSVPLLWSTVEEDQRAHLTETLSEAVGRIHSSASHRYTYSNMKTCSKFAYSVKVANFANLRAILSSYSEPPTLANTLEALYVV